MPLLSVEQQIDALRLLQEVAPDNPTWHTVTAAVSEAAEAQGYAPDVAEQMGQAAAHQIGLQIARGSKPRGGARPNAGRKPYPELRPGAVVIDVKNCWAVVSRWVRTGGGFQLEPAANSAVLEEAAEAEVAAIGGDIAIEGIYPCSSALAKLAQWPDAPPA